MLGVRVPPSWAASLLLCVLLTLGAGSATPAEQSVLHATTGPVVADAPAAHGVHAGDCPLVAKVTDGAPADLVPAAISQTMAAPAETEPSRGAQGVSELPSGVDDAVLEDLGRQLSRHSGFQDVQIALDGEPYFIAWFAPGSDLPELQEIVAPYSMTAVHAPATSPVRTATDPPLIPGPCGNNRPGGNYGLCPFAFLLAGSDGKTYATTAGHCLPPVGGSVSLGEVAFRLANGIGQDFGLIAIDSLIVPQMSPAMCYWGGPTALSSDPSVGDKVHIYGVGFPAGAADALKPRSGVIATYGLSSFMYLGPVFPGDSGAPIALESGEAFGVHTHGASGVLGVSAPLSNPMIKFGMRLDKGIALAEADLGIELTLLTAALE